MTRKPLLSALVLGFLYALCFAVDLLPAAFLPWLQVFVLAGLFHLVANAARPGVAAQMGLFFGLGAFVTGLYWLTISMSRYGGLPMWLAIVALVMFSAYLALYPTLSAWALRRLSSGQTRVVTPLGMIGIASLWASTWTLGEWLRASVLTGFSWLNTAAGQVDGWLAGWSAWTGPYGVTFLTAWISAIVACTLNSASLREANSFKGLRTVPLLLAGVFCAMGALLGQWQLSEPQGQALVIRLVQGDIDQAEKFTPQGFFKALELYQSLSAHEQDAQTHKPDLVLLPETVMTHLPNRIPPDVWQTWIRTAAQNQTSLLMGSPMPAASGDGYTNSVIVVDGQDSAQDLAQAKFQFRYDKQHLVPFGEFVPWGFQWFVDLMNIPLGNFSAGQENQQPIRVATQAIAPNICYEDVFAQGILPAVRQGATILANFSNLAWFGDTTALTQHWQMARLRAMETRRPTVRSTNTGMTGAIDHWGQTIAVLPTMSAGYLDVIIQGQSGLTPYVRTGNLPILVLCGLILLLGLIRRRRLHTVPD